MQLKAHSKKVQNGQSNTITHCYYVTCSIVYAIDLLTHRRYIEIIKKVMEQILFDVKGLEIEACSFSSSKIHLLVRSIHKPFVQRLIDDFKQVSEYELLQAVTEEGKDERRNWMLWLFGLAARSKQRQQEHQVWEREFDVVEWIAPDHVKERYDRVLQHRPVMAAVSSSRWFLTSEQT